MSTRFGNTYLLAAYVKRKCPDHLCIHTVRWELYGSFVGLMVPVEYIKDKAKTLSDCADAQADLDLCCCFHMALRQFFSRHRSYSTINPHYTDTGYNWIIIVISLDETFPNDVVTVNQNIIEDYCIKVFKKHMLWIFVRNAWLRWL